MSNRFWDQQALAILSPAQREVLTRRVRELKDRQIQLRAWVDELERRGATDEEWQDYDRAFAAWNNAVIDVAEDSHLKITSEELPSEGLDDVPFEGNRRTGLEGQGGLSNL